MRILSYLFVYLLVSLLMIAASVSAASIWDPRIIVPVCSLLFTLLVWLVSRLTGTGRTGVEIVGTAVFLLLFAPGSQLFFAMDETAVVELGSQCIVPFFLSQYGRISRKNFRSAYVLMLLMGIFCSFTHDGITLPLCLAFLLLAWQRRSELFRLACWPMMAGWLAGTVLQFAVQDHLPDLTPDLGVLGSRTALVLGLLWDTKIFVLGVGLSLWLTTTSWGRRELLCSFRRNRLIAYSLLFALSCVPFAPLGIDNAVTGVCFFGMLWTMLLLKGLERRYVGAARARRS